MKREVLRMEHVYADVNGKDVLSDFKLNLFAGELVLLYGFPGCGVNVPADILSGRCGIRAGRVLIDEKELLPGKFGTPEQMGVFSLQGEGNLVPELSVAENLFLGGKSRFFSVVVPKRLLELEAEKVVRKFDLNIDIKTKARNLSYSQEIAVKLLKAYVKGAKILTIRELIDPSYLRGGTDVRHIIELLKADGIAILWAEQNIEHIRNMADRIVVLREGRNVGTFFRDEFDSGKFMNLASSQSMSVSAAVSDDNETDIMSVDIKTPTGTELKFGIPRNSISGIWSNDPRDIDLICSVMSGMPCEYSGEVKYRGKPFHPKTPSDALNRGVRVLYMKFPEKHFIEGFSVAENMLFDSISPGKRIFSRLDRERLRYVRNRYRINHPDWPEDKWYKLSAARQRILLYEKCIYEAGEMYFFAESFVKDNAEEMEMTSAAVEELIKRGKTVVFLSNDFHSLCNICGRLFLVRDGCLAGCVRAADYPALDISAYVE